MGITLKIKMSVHGYDLYSGKQLLKLVFWQIMKSWWA